MNTDTEFADRFKSLVAEIGAPTTQKRLGAWLGVSGTMAWCYLNGEKLPAMASAIAMARKLNCCVEWLLTGRGPKRPDHVDPIANDFNRLSPRDQAIARTVIQTLLHTPE